jgi:IclR family transcriptional regulator, acetate operon repressor
VEQEFQRGTQTIDRAAQLLTLVLEADEPRALSDLAGDAELPKSTASRLLSALERQGLVEQQGRRGSFEPGPVLRRYANRGQLVELAQPHLEALSAISGETINLAVPGPLGVEHLAQIESRHFLGTGDWVGRRVPYDRTAVGKVLVAFGGAADALDPTVMARVRHDGYATAVDELEVGLTGLAAPVIGAGERAIAALSISGPTLRLGAQQIEDLYPQLINEARALGHDMGANAA